ncbi:MAG TPA: hypothetical protein VJB70_05255 [Candidatus Paceibacterota bacterium]
MWGTALAASAEQKHQEFEKKRKRWIETHTVGSESVEFLVVNCTHCGQPWPRQKILRFDEKEFQRWQRIRSEIFPIKNRLFWMPGGIIVGILGALIMWLATESTTWAIIGYFLAPTLWGFALWHFDRRRINRCRRERLNILANHDNLPLEKVGMLDEYPTEYIILPEESSA